MRNTVIAAFGLVSYAAAMWSVLALVAWNANLAQHQPQFAAAFPLTVDGESSSTQHEAWQIAVLKNVALMFFFFTVHSILARTGTKEAMSSIVPAAAERSLFCAVAACQLTLLMALWTPIREPTVWTAPKWLHTPLWLLQAAGCAFALTSTFAINHFETFGLTQAVKGDTHAPPLQTGWHYAIVRHPLALGFIVNLLSQPHMTAGHLLVSATFTLYFIIGTVVLEERKSQQQFGAQWQQYSARVPAIVPCMYGLGQRRQGVNGDKSAAAKATESKQE